MTTLLYTHPACLDHDPGRHHPESPARLRAVLEALDAPEFARLRAARGARSRARRHRPGASAPASSSGCSPRCPRSGHVGIDADTILSPAFGPGRAARRRGGRRRGRCGGRQARPTTRSARCARPAIMPSPPRAMGFCLFNNVAIGALQGARGARPRPRRGHRFRRPSRQRHAGLLLTTTPSLFYASTHQLPLYPGTGAARETGVGNIVNVPLRPIAGSRRVPARRHPRHPAGARRVPARDGADLGRVRRASERSARATVARRGRLHLGNRAAPGDRPAAMPGAAWSRRSKAATIWRRSAPAPPRMFAC